MAKKKKEKIDAKLYCLNKTNPAL